MAAANNNNNASADDLSEDLIKGYINATIDGIIDCPYKAKSPQHHTSFKSFNTEVDTFKGKLIAMKETYKKDQERMVFNFTTTKYDWLRDISFKVVSAIADVICHLEKATSVPFDISKNPLDNEMDLFEPKLNELLAAVQNLRQKSTINP